MVVELVGPDVYKVRRWGDCESATSYVGPTFEQRSGDTVHAIHDTPIGAQNYGVSDIDVQDEAGVFDDLPNSP